MQRSGRDLCRVYAKEALASAIVWSGTRAIAELFVSKKHHQPLVLGYHRIVDDFASASRTEMPAMLTSRAMFERHVDWLSSHFRFVTLDEVGEHVASGVPFTEPVVALTFDDGYQDVYEYAFPILKRKGIPAAVFVVTSLVGQDAWQLHDKLYQIVARAFASWNDPRRELLGVLAGVGIPGVELLRDRSATRTPTAVTATLLPKLSHADVSRVIHGLESAGWAGTGTRPYGDAATFPRTLNWEEIETMHRAGITIGSHTETHVSLPMESQNVVTRELLCSRLTLERRLGERVRHFAYPGGEFTEMVVEAAASSGYEYAYTACAHGAARHPQLTIPRLLLWEGSSVDVDGHFSPEIFGCQAWRLWPAFRCERVHQA